MCSLIKHFNIRYMMNFLLTVLVFCLSSFSLSQRGPCVDEREDGCCSGTTWNRSLQKCTDCIAGYFGINCEETCEFPYYGMKCSENCKCDNESCHFAFGCLKQGTDIVSRWSTIKNKKISTYPSSAITTVRRSLNVRSIKESNVSILQMILIICGALLFVVGVPFAFFTFYEKILVEPVQQPGAVNKSSIYEEVQ
ncbi:uncharacterized protein LOC134273508 [Saccostrea cucullata]|uniref:uncharacterized protein LOC134273508 n=1 Tax=Saccostrea cuccullata TaxID=36930 RepID=UPI002ED2F7AF